MYEYETVPTPDKRRFKSVHEAAVKDAVGNGWRAFRVAVDDPAYGGDGRKVTEVAEEHRKDLIRAGHANHANVTVRVADEPEPDGRLLIQFAATSKGSKPRKAAQPAAQA